MLNTVVLMGRITHELEMRQTQNGTIVCTFTLAVERSYSSGGDRQTDFIDCIAWRNTAEFICKYFNKGDMIAIDGELQTRNWEDKQGNKRKTVEANVRQAHFCGSKAAKSDSAARSTNYTATPQQATQSQSQATQQAFQQSGLEDILDDADLPF